MGKFEAIIVFILGLSFIVFPFDFYEFKLPVLAFFLIRGIAKTLVKDSLDISPNVFLLFIINFGLGVFFIVYGQLLGNSTVDSLPYTIALYLIFPLGFLIILSIISKSIFTLDFSINVFLWGFLITSLVLIGATFAKKYGMNDILIFFRLNVDLRSDVTRINYGGISSLIFLFPLFFSMLLFRIRKNKKLLILIVFSLLLSLISIFLTGRRALLLTFVLSILIIFLLKKHFEFRVVINKVLFKYLIFAFFLIIPVIVLNFSRISTIASATVEYVLNKNDVFNVVEDERSKQAHSFIEHIKYRPLLGYGHGSFMENIIRDEDKPWRYELSYLDLIFHTGFLGFIGYAIGPLWILLSLYKIAKFHKAHRGVAVGLMTGLVSILIAYSTNPYLNAFDIQWVIYFPILFILIMRSIYSYNNKQNA